MRALLRWRSAAAMVLAALAGCATNPLTGRSQLMVVPESSALSGSASAYTSMVGGLAKKGQVEQDTERAKRVREITDKLIAQAVRFRPDSANWDWQLTVINDPKVVNAFCMAGGKMAIYTGMWDKLKATDDEIANVMGHEIGHALANHTQERMSIAMTSSIGASLLAVAASSSTNTMSRNGDLFASAAALAITLPNSRGGESEADQIGIELAARAGYDPRAAVTLWQKMAKLGGAPPEFMSTHPSPEHRMSNLQGLVAKVDPYYQSAKRGEGPKDAPSFLNANHNERRVGDASRDEYAARVRSEGETLTFLADKFDAFKRGAVQFDCRTACVFSYMGKRRDWQKMHADGAWRDLAVSVMQVGYQNDLSYFLLGESARHLGLADAAKTYYGRALDSAKAGLGCSGDACAGFDVQKLARAAL